MLHYGLHYSWIGLSLCRFVACGRLIQLCLYGLYCSFHFTLDGLLQLGPHGTDSGSHF
jgi:hypothetical protein